MKYRWGPKTARKEESDHFKQRTSNKKQYKFGRLE